jgi:hypothetical protein
MKTEKNQEQRAEIRKQLADIVIAVEKINEVMIEIPHHRGIVQRSLRDMSGQYIFHMKDTLDVCYDNSGKRYRITVHEEEIK